MNNSSFSFSDRLSGQLAKLLFRLSTFIRNVGKNLTHSDREWNAVLKRWRQQNGDQHLRTHYEDLNANSVVMDLGGYEGQWASDIFARYLCEVHVFEPHPHYAGLISERFAKNDRIKVYPFGLGKEDEQVSLSVQGDATSMFLPGKDRVAATIKSMEHFLAAASLQQIDLIKINIEGAEYDLLESMIEKGLITRFRNIQVQFHYFIPHAEERMAAIQRSLQTTHQLTYQFRFLWENWQLQLTP